MLMHIAHGWKWCCHRSNAKCASINLRVRRKLRVLRVLLRLRGRQGAHTIPSNRRSRVKRITCWPCTQSPTHQASQSGTHHHATNHFSFCGLAATLCASLIAIPEAKRIDFSVYEAVRAPAWKIERAILRHNAAKSTAPKGPQCRKRNELNCRTAD